MYRSAVRVRVLAGLGISCVLFLAVGTAALAVILEGRPGLAVPLLMTAVLLAGAMLGTQSSLRRRLGEGDRLAALMMTAGSASMVALLAALFLAGNIIVGDWDTAAASCALMGAFGLVAAISVAIYRNGRARVLPPFQPLRPEAFREDPDPPAYAPPARPEPRVLQSPGGFVERMLRALWLRR